MTTGVRPFRLAVSDAVLQDLHERLARTRFPGEVTDSGWTYGTNLAYLKELVAYWRDGYDWRAAEARLNTWPQFLAPVQGADLHFIHVRGNGPQPLPLLLSHGWPGSFVEFLEAIGPLSDPGAYGGDPADAFDVVVPSLPGYGFSTDPGVPGLTPAAIGERFVTLMRDVLGYPRFALQGGDWGSIISTAIASHHPELVKGLHLNFLVVRPPAGDPSALSEEERAFLATFERERNEETGYQWIQGTRPQTLAYALTDSPAGLAAWIVEKFRAWSGGDEVEQHFTKDQILTNVMVYWLSGCIGSSTRLYYEARHSSGAFGTGARIEVPTGYARFPGELAMWRPPRAWAERAFNLVHWTEMSRGGHFAAFEAPELLVEDVRAFFRPLRGG